MLCVHTLTCVRALRHPVMLGLQLLLLSSCVGKTPSGHVKSKRTSRRRRSEVNLFILGCRLVDGDSWFWFLLGPCSPSFLFSYFLFPFLNIFLLGEGPTWSCNVIPCALSRSAAQFYCRAPPSNSSLDTEIPVSCCLSWT
ncbi:hypothetical protein F4775DRAFT_566583 [Biscogniauxia sp. FL1348]|nr:hypothetical protein F4775DRAFT_566583 [Biscogniauxia sp. FL1348]